MVRFLPVTCPMGQSWKNIPALRTSTKVSPSAVVGGVLGQYLAVTEVVLWTTVYHWIVSARPYS